MSSAQIKAELDQCIFELGEQIKLKEQINVAIDAVNEQHQSLSDATNGVDSFKWVRNNLDEYWKASGVGDRQSCIDGLDFLSEQISESGPILSACSQVLTDANKKINEIDAKIASLSAQRDSLESAYKAALEAELEASKSEL